MQAQLKAAVRDVPDFPIKGILFKDITPILQDPKLFRLAVDTIADRQIGKNIKSVVGIDARGFIFAGAAGLKLGAAFVPIRKKGKLPWFVHEQGYDLEYGSNTLAIHIDAIQPGTRVILVDDLLATGGTAAAAAALIHKLGGHLLEINFLIELSFLKGREKLKDLPVRSVVVY